MITPLDKGTQIVDKNGIMTDEFHDWVSDVALRGLFIGTGTLRPQ